MSQLPVLIWRHVPGQTLGSTADILNSAGLSTTVWDVAESMPPDFDPHHWAGLVVMGGPYSVYQCCELPFLQREIQWLRLALQHKLPILGLCLGGQLLAKALGAKVAQNPLPEVGWHSVELTSAGEMDPLLSDTPSPALVCQWHGDTFDLPAGGVLLASSAICRHQAFRFGTLAWGFQFHPEINGEQLADWIERARPEQRCCPDAAHEQRIREESNKFMSTAQILGRRIIGRFGKLCKEVAASRGV